MHDIETLITHFLGVSWGPVIPPGEAHAGIEATKGNNGYYLTSDGNTIPYRVTDSHAVVRAHADGAVAEPRPHDPGPAGGSRQPRLRAGGCGPMKTPTMLERH